MELEAGHSSVHSNIVSPPGKHVGISAAWSMRVVLTELDVSENAYIKLWVFINYSVPIVLIPLTEEKFFCCTLLQL